MHTVGRIALILFVLGIGLWATRMEYLPLPARDFWLLAIVYLATAQIAWAMVARHGRRMEVRQSRKGLLRIPRWQVAPSWSNRWFFEAGRTSLTDIQARQDASRECVNQLLTAMADREGLPRVHLLVGPSGSGRSTLLLRMGKMLTDLGNAVFISLPTTCMPDVREVVEAAKHGSQVFLLIDDLDLRPDAEEIIHVIHHARARVVVAATVASLSRDEKDLSGFAAVPVHFLSDRAMIHRPAVTSSDLDELRRLLSQSGRLRGEIKNRETVTVNYLAASRRLQGLEQTCLIWKPAIENALPIEAALSLAFAGVAEVGIPRGVFNDLVSPQQEKALQKADLCRLSLEYYIPPHAELCRELIEFVGPNSPRVHDVLRHMLTVACKHEPGFAARLLYALVQRPVTARAARVIAAEVLPEGLPKGASATCRRLWHTVLLSVLQQIPEPPPSTDQSTTPVLLEYEAVTRLEDNDIEGAKRLYGQLMKDDVLWPEAYFNLALCLGHEKQYDLALEQLAKTRGITAGDHFLRGLLAIKRRDYALAIDQFNLSRQKGFLPVVSNREQAFAYLRSGAPKASLPLFENALQDTPKRVELYGGLAVANLQAGRSQRASSQSARAIQAGVDPNEVRRAVAAALLEARAYELAVVELDCCVTYRDDDLEAWRSLAFASLRTGNFEREEECVRRLLSENPNDEHLRLNLARCLRDQRRHAEAFDVALPLATNSGIRREACLLAAEIAGALDRMDMQRELGMQAVQHGDESGWGLFWTAQGLAATNEASAEQFYTEAIQRLQEQLRGELRTRDSARIWQGIYLAARAIGNNDLAERAKKQAARAAAVCLAIGDEVDSLVSRRSVPGEVLMKEVDSDPPNPGDIQGGDDGEPPSPETQPQEAPRRLLGLELHKSRFRKFPPPRS